MKSRHLTAAIFSIMALLVGALVLAPPAGAASYNSFRGPNYTSRVVLTFDDCPRTLSSYKAVLSYAREANIGLVLAPTGNCVSRFRNSYGVNMAALARSYGQYVINHSISHPDLRKLSCAGVARQLRAPGVVTNFGRPPYGAVNAAVRCGYARVGMKRWLWTVDTRDWTGKSQAQVVNYVVRNGRAGSTVLMHMQWRGFHPTAISRMKAGLAERGLKVCRAYGSTSGRIRTSPVNLPQQLPC